MKGGGPVFSTLPKSGDPVESHRQQSGKKSLKPFISFEKGHDQSDSSDKKIMGISVPSDKSLINFFHLQLLFVLTPPHAHSQYIYIGQGKARPGKARAGKGKAGQGRLRQYLAKQGNT